MTISTLHNKFATIIILSCGMLSACEKKEEQHRSTPKPIPQTDLPIEKPLPETADSITTLRQIEDRLNADFKHGNLLGLLGKKISPEMLKQIETEGQSLPEFNDMIGKGWKTFVVLQGSGGITFHIAEGYLVVFGYSYRGSTSGNSGGDDDYHLNDFKFSSESTTKVSDENFNETPMMVKIYKSNKDSTVHAVSYARGMRRTLAFYDSSKVEASKLLPSVPDAAGMEALNKAKELLRNKAK